MKFNKLTSVGSLAPIAKKESSAHSYATLKKQLDKYIKIGNGEQNKSFGTCSLICVLVRSFWCPLLVSGVLQFIYAVLTAYVAPVSVRFLLNFIEKKNEPQLNGYLYVLLLFGSQVLRSWSVQHHYHLMNRFALRCRAAITATVYRKGLVLSSEARKNASVGEIVNLMSVDSTRFIEIAQILHLFWSAPFQIGIGLYLLYETVDIAFLSAVAVFFLTFVFNMYAADVFNSVQERLMTKKDARLKILTEVLNGIKLIKLCAWEVLFHSRIKDIRNDELNSLRNAGYVNGMNQVAWTCTAIFASLSVFATFIAMSKKILEPQIVFLVTTIFTVMYVPLTSLPSAIASILTMIVTLRRLAKFFSSEELATYFEHDESKFAVHLIGASFAWKKEDSLILNNLNLDVERGKLIAVIGEVGSGKSSLLSAISGGMIKSSGRIIVNGSLAYVPQQAWIQNMSIRENILFGKKYDPIFYQKVVNACSLKKDFDALPGGDSAEAGERGINLSGGQKQRISLARSIYQDSEIFLLDDPLSAVDANVGNCIFENAIGPFGLMSKKTRIFVTHGLNFLHSCDLVIVMKDGRFEEIGTFKENCEREGGAFNELLKQIIQKIPEQESLEDLDQVTLDSISPTVRDLYEQKRRIASEGSYHDETKKGKPSSPTRIVDVRCGRLIEDEEMHEKGVSYDVYLLYAKAGGSWLWVHSFFLFLMQSTNLAANIWLERWTEKDLNNTLGLGVYAGCASLILILTIAYAWVFVLYATRAAKYLHEKLTYQLFRAPMSFFDTTPAGRILNRCGRDINTIDCQIPLSFSQVTSFVWIFAQSVIAVVYSTPTYILPFIPMMIIYGLLQRCYVKSSRQYRRIEAITRSPVYSFFQESLLGSSSIRAFGQKERFCHRSEKLVDVNQSAHWTFLSAQECKNILSLCCCVLDLNWLYCFSCLGIYLDMLGVAMVCSASLIVVASQATLGSSAAGLALSFSLAIADVLDLGVRAVATLETEIVALERIKEYIKMSSEAKWSNKLSKNLKNWPTNGVVEFKKYSTKYRPDLKLVLKNICLRIGAREKIGVVGRTGAGKSSLSMALFRLLEPFEGKIIIDDVDISRIGLHDLRNKLAIIPQEPLLFSGALRLNLDPFRKHSDAQLWHALDISHMKSYILAQPSQLMFNISEGGINLSTGQRQLICLARAFLRQAKILVLDEATATVDTVTDALIQETIRVQFEQCTVITIAHRLNTIMDSDRVLVLQQGEVIECDRPDVLMKNSKSVFAKMVKESQS